MKNLAPLLRRRLRRPRPTHRTRTPTIAPVGQDRDEAEQLATRLDRERYAVPVAPTGPITFGEFLTNAWVPHKRRQARATTA